MVIENTFGITCSRWRVLLKPIECTVPNAVKIVRAVCVLHNFLRIEAKGAKNPVAMIDSWREKVAPLPQAPLRKRGANRFRDEAMNIREILIEYFNGVGSVKWQQRMI
jgi:hypothetical protein